MSHHHLSVPHMESLLFQAVRTGQYKTMISRFMTYLNEDLHNDVIYFYLGLLYVKTGDSNQGVECLEKARKSGLDLGQRLRCLIFLGTIYADLGSYAQSERALREALQTGISDPSPYSALGAVFYARNMVDQALDALEKALKIDPEYPGALNNLGYILIETKHDTTRGLMLCRKAVELDPNNYAYRDSLGKALVVHGQYKEAEKEFEKGLKLAPNNSFLIQNLKDLRNNMRPS